MLLDDNGIAVSVHVAPFKSGVQSGPFNKPHGEGGRLMTMNNGVIVAKGDPRNAAMFKHVLEDYWLPSVCTEGFAQTEFNRFIDWIKASQLF